jgi:GrpB-like predicted nucleotidyltransferase (UPF0157 family)
MSDAIVEIIPYDPAWPQRFLVERDLLSQALREWLVGDIEHIGSTSIPGLAAKPVIDMMAPVQSLVCSEGAIARTVQLGYAYYPYKPDLMHWFCKPSPAIRTHHLHLVPAHSRVWRERLAFRDALRSSAALCAEYQALKETLAVQHRRDRDAYTEAKSPFIQRVLASTG